MKKERRYKRMNESSSLCVNSTQKTERKCYVAIGTSWKFSDSFTVLPQALQMFWTILHVIITGKAYTNVDDI